MDSFLSKTNSSKYNSPYVLQTSHSSPVLCLYRLKSPEVARSPYPYPNLLLLTLLPYFLKQLHTNHFYGEVLCYI